MRNKGVANRRSTTPFMVLFIEMVVALIGLKFAIDYYVNEYHQSVSSEERNSTLSRLERSETEILVLTVSRDAGLELKALQDRSEDDLSESPIDKTKWTSTKSELETLRDSGKLVPRDELYKLTESAIARVEQLLSL